MINLQYIENFTFFIGASCWETHQLQGEISRGYWLPFCGPTTIAASGLNVGDQNDVVLSPESKSSDLWLKIMRSLGGYEAKFANLMLKNKGSNDSGDGCDDV